jgi:hypothetical protein
MTNNSDLPSTKVWSLDPLLYDTLPRSFYESVCADRRLFITVLAIPLTLALIYPLMNRILLKHFQKYLEIEPAAKKVVVLHHAVEAVVLSLAFPIFTYYIIRVNFRVHEDLAELKSELVILGSLCILFIVMYSMELASRFDSPRPVVVFHHVLAYLDGFLIVVFPTTVMFKTGIILVYFISFEALTFVGLFMYRVFPKSKLTQHVILAGMVSFGASRPIQVLWICGAIFGSWNDENMIKWQAVMQLLVTCILTVLQLWTLKIHYGLWLRSRGEERSFGSQKEDELDPSYASSVSTPSSTSSHHIGSSTAESKIGEDQSDRKKHYPVSLMAQEDFEENSPV